jgi:hypothetical protein
MNDETRFKAKDFDEPSVLVGLTKAEINELIAREYKRVDQWYKEAWPLAIDAKKAQAEGAPNAAALRFLADSADRLWHAAVDYHKRLLNQTSDSWPKPRKPHHMTQDEYETFCQKLVEDWKAPSKRLKSS